MIIGLGGGGDAETTSLYLAKILQNENVRITKLARGLPAGLELEHVDMLTLTRAMSDRIEIVKDH